MCHIVAIWEDARCEGKREEGREERNPGVKKEKGLMDKADGD